MTHKKKDRPKFKQTSLGNSVVGLAWYFPSQWQQLREVSADSEHLEKTYPEWLAAFEEAFQKLSAAGIAVVKVPVDIEALIGWCRERSLPIDSKARAQYVSERLEMTSSAAQ